LGEFKGIDGSVRDFNGKFEADLHVSAIGIYGTGSSKTGATSKGLSVEGTRSLNEVSLEIWLQFQPLSRIPLTFVGSIAEEGDEIIGNFETECHDPDECDCGGGFGVLWLWRELEGSRPRMATGSPATRPKLRAVPDYGRRERRFGRSRRRAGHALRSR
jgi:hypothetical protein